MNKEGYKDPTYDAAMRSIKNKERICKQHGVQIGETIKLKLILPGLDPSKDKAKKVSVKIVDVNEKFVTYRCPAGYCESMFWPDYHAAKGKGG